MTNYVRSEGEQHLRDSLHPLNAALNGVFARTTGCETSAAGRNKYDRSPSKDSVYTAGENKPELTPPVQLETEKLTTVMTNTLCGWAFGTESQLIYCNMQTLQTMQSS
jgi:hypothetical protein